MSAGNRPATTPVAAAEVGGSAPSGNLSQAEDAYFIASQWQLIWRKFRRHRLAWIGGSVLAILLVMAVFSEFWSPYDIYDRHTDLVNLPPQRIRILDQGSFHRPFVYGVTSERSTTTYFLEFSEDTSHRYPVRFLSGALTTRYLGSFPATSISSVWTSPE